MDVPGIVQAELDGEEVAASVSLGGEDGLFVTPSRTLVFRSESLLSDESVESYPHDADRVTVKDGRRKSRITLTYSLDGDRDFAVPSSVVDDVLHPVLAGVLNGSGITDPGETVVQTFRFSELTLVVTSDRLLKHVGGAVWDEDHEQYHFEDVTGLDFEEGSVATQIVIEVDGRPQRIKTPNEHIAVVRERLTQALFAYYDVDGLDALNALVDPQEETPADTGSPVDFGEGVDPLGSSSGSRPADTSGDPFLDEDKAETLDDPSSAASDAGGHANAAADAENQRRPVSGETEDDANRRRAQPADAESSERRAEPTASESTERRAEPAASESSAGVDQPDPSTASVDTAAGDGTPDVEDPLASTAVDDVADEPSAATSEPDDADADADASEFAAAGFEPATETGVTPADLAARLEDLEARVEAQNSLLEQQQALIQQLIQELSDR
jgi:hypothetical protein